MNHRFLRFVALAMAMGGCAGGGWLSPEAQQIRNTVVTTSLAAGCGIGIGAGVATANPIILGGAAGACVGALLGFTHPVREPIYPTIVYDPYRPIVSPQARQINLNAFLVSEDPALKSQLAKELAERGWRIIGTFSVSSGPPPGATVFFAKRVGGQIQVAMVTPDNWYAAAVGVSTSEAVVGTLTQFGLI